MYIVPKKSYRILVIDDEEKIIKGLKDLLIFHLKVCKPQDFDFAKSAEEALAKLGNSEYDLVISDWALTDGKNADYILERVRHANSNVKDICFIILSGQADKFNPTEIVSKFNIQGYCTKEGFESILNSPIVVAIKSALNTVNLVDTVKRERDGYNIIIDSLGDVLQLKGISYLLKGILNHVLTLVQANDAFIVIDENLKDADHAYVRGVGKYNVEAKEKIKELPILLLNNKSEEERLIMVQILEKMGTAKRTKEVQMADQGVVLPVINTTSSEAMGYIYVEFDNWAKETPENIAEDYSRKERFLKTFSAIIALTINNSILYSTLGTQERNYENKISEDYSTLMKQYGETVEILRKTVDAKHPYTRGHSDRVSENGVKTGLMLGVTDEQELEDLKNAGLFHDIGKLSISNDILDKDTKPTNEEWEEIKKHPQIGADILNAMSKFKKIIRPILEHHEKISGHGYPDGKKGKDIHLFSKILTVCDSFDAMISIRKYNMKERKRPRYPFEAALELWKDSNPEEEIIHFDRKVVKAFLEVLKDEGYINFIEKENGEVEISDTGKRYDFILEPE